MEETENLTLNDLAKEEPKVEAEPVIIPDKVEVAKKKYKCTLTGHEADTKAAIYKHRNYHKKNGTLPEGKGKIMYIGDGEEKPVIKLKKKPVEPEIQEPVKEDIYEPPTEEETKEQIYLRLKTLEHEAKDSLDGYKVKCTPESDLRSMKEEIQFVVSLLQNKGLSKTAYQVLLATAGATEQLTQHEKVNPYCDLTGYTSAIEGEREDIEEVLARCIREAPVEFQQMLTPQSHLMIIMTSLAVKVNAGNQEKKRNNFLGNVPEPSQKK